MTRPLKADGLRVGEAEKLKIKVYTFCRSPACSFIYISRLAESGVRETSSNASEAKVE